MVGGCGVDSSGPGLDPVGGFLDHSNKSLCSI